MRSWMIRVSCVLVIALCVTAAWAQDASAPATSPQDQKQADKDKKEQDKKDKKAKKEKKGPQDTLAGPETFSETVANDVFGTIRDGLEGHSQRLMLSAFDGDKMDGYLSFEDAIEALFNKYDAFRIHFRILQATQEGSKGIVLASVEMEEVPKQGGQPQRRSSELRAQLERGKKGWRIVDFSPRNFFQ